MLQFQPDEVEALEGLGVLLFQLGLFDEARALFVQGLAIMPDSARLHSNLGEVYRVLGRPDDAAGELEKSLAIDPGSAQSWNVLGHLAQDQERYFDAVAAYREVIGIWPQFVPGHINLGIVLLALHRRAEAAEALRAGLRIDPDNHLALTKLGQALWEMRDPDLVDEAETHCRRALALEPQAPEVLESLGQVLRLKGRPSECLSITSRGWNWPPAAFPSGYRWPNCFWEPVVTVTRYGSPRRPERSIPKTHGCTPNSATYRLPASDLKMQPDTTGQPWRRSLLGRGSPRTRSRTARAGIVGSSRGVLPSGDSHRPYSHHALGCVARLQVERGDGDESCQTARRVLALRPNVADAYWRLASNLKGTLPDRDIEAMQGLLKHKYVSHSLKAGLHFAPGSGL